MLLLSAQNVTKTYGANLILSNINVEVQAKDRIGLVGHNGAGKSTLLKILAGVLEPDAGKVHAAKGLTIGYLAQNNGLDATATVEEEMLAVYSRLRQKENKLRQLEQSLAQVDPKNETKRYEQILSQYDRLLNEFTAEGGYTYQSRIQATLTGLGFQKSFWTKKISELSGGQKTRLALARLLLQEPDILMLDEPTNHLDISTLEWLENTLQHYPKAVVIISHDRFFLDRIVTTIVEIEDHNARQFPGNYSDYVKQKEAHIEQQKKAYEKQQKEIARTEEFIQKNIARASTTKRAQSRRKKLEKMARIPPPKKNRKHVRFQFQVEKRSGNEVLKLDNLAVGYKKQKLLSSLNFSLFRGERAAIIGKNGIGKSTLLKTIAGVLSPRNGTIHTGTDVTVAYYDQEQTHLYPHKTVLDELWDEYPHIPEKEIRTILGHFLFSGDDVFRQIVDLSGGEKARVALARLMMRKANFLILDEPTNHLDLASKEVLEQALSDYPATLLFVSHDRYFINKLANKIIEISEDGLKVYNGHYDNYLQKREEELAKWHHDEIQQQALQNQEKLPQTETKKEARQRKRRLITVEDDIERLEKAIARLEEELARPDIYQNPDRIRTCTEELNEKKAQLHKLLEEWESLQL